MRTADLLNQKVQQTIIVDIMTANYYLEKGLSLIAAECINVVGSPFSEGEWHPGRVNDDAVKLCLIDVDYICEQKDQWPQISKKIKKADSVVFISFTQTRSPGVPHLALHNPIEILKESVHCIIKNVKKNGPVLTYDRLVSSLSYFERDVFAFLMRGYDIREISASLRVTNKVVYRIRSQIMKKFDLHNRKSLHQLLNICNFMRYHFYELYATRPFISGTQNNIGLTL